MEKDRILKLIKKPKKGLLRIVFSRLVVVFLMLGLQIFLYIAFFALISQFLPQFAVFQSIFAFGMVIYLFNNKMDSSAKLTWLALIAVLPIFGAFLLAFTQRIATSMGNSLLDPLSKEFIKPFLLLSLMSVLSLVCYLMYIKKRSRTDI